MNRDVLALLAAVDVLRDYGLDGLASVVEQVATNISPD